MSTGEGLGISSYPNDCLCRSALVGLPCGLPVIHTHTLVLYPHCPTGLSTDVKCTCKGAHVRELFLFKMYREVSREMLSQLSNRPTTPSNHKGPKCLGYSTPEVFRQLLDDSVILLPAVPKPLPFACNNFLRRKKLQQILQPLPP